MSVVHIYPEVRDNEGNWHAIVQDKTMRCPSCRRGHSRRKCRRCDDIGYISTPFYQTSYEASSWLLEHTFDNLYHPSDWIKPEGVARGEDACRSADFSVVQRALRPVRGWNNAYYCTIPMESVLTYDWNKEQVISFWMQADKFHEWYRGDEKSAMPVMSDAPDPDRHYNKTYPITIKEVLDHPATFNCYWGMYQNIRVREYRVRVQDFNFTPAEVCPKFMKALPLLQAVAPPERTRLVFIAYY